jgi:hypothetical protein
MGPSGTCSLFVDINNNPIPLCHHELMGAYTLTNSDGVFARVASMSNSSYVKAGEVVNRGVVWITGLSSISYAGDNCTGEAYTSGSTVLFTSGSGLVSLVPPPPPINTYFAQTITVEFWKYDMFTPSGPSPLIRSVRSATGICGNDSTPSAIPAALHLLPSTPLTFLNAMWPGKP